MSIQFSNTAFSTAQSNRVYEGYEQLSELLREQNEAYKDAETEVVEIVKRTTVNGIFDELNAAGKTRHGFSCSSDPERLSIWNCWRNILQRCNNPLHPRYHDYGGRGIECRFASFEEFARHVEFRPTEDHSIDRIDNDRHYEPGNLKWSNSVEQAANRRAPTKRKAQ